MIYITCQICVINLIFVITGISYKWQRYQAMQVQYYFIKIIALICNLQQEKI